MPELLNQSTTERAMDTMTDDPFADLGPAKKPCGCKDTAAVSAGEGDLFDTAELEQALGELEAGDGGDAELAELEAALDELELGAVSEGDASLEDLVGLTGRHPGLKVTISF
jgi:hypothetical protein